MSSNLTSGTPDYNRSPLLAQHLADLRKSGLTDETVAASGVYSEGDPRRVKELLGGYLGIRAAAALGPCLAFPFLDPDGKPMTWLPEGAGGGAAPRPFVRLKPDRPRSRNGRVVKYESPWKGGNRLYLPPGVGPALADPARPLVIVEGEKKALAGTQEGVPTLGLSGVWNWALKRPKDETGRGTGPRKLIGDLERINWSGRRVAVVFDSDLKDKPEVAWARWHLAQVLAARGADVRAADLPDGPDGAKCGLDDFLVARGRDALRAILEAARPPSRPGGDWPEECPDPGQRRVVLLGEDEHRVNDAVAAELARDGAVYQRGGELVRVSVEVPPTDGPAVSVVPRIESIPGPALRDVISRRVQFVKVTEEGERPAHPPAWCVGAVGARGTWAGVRPLAGVVSFPVLRRDGTVLTEAGYDARTGLFLHWPHAPLPIPDAPTATDAKAAAAELLEVVSDFPFAAEMHKAAWLAALLTALARPAFDGPAPLFLVDANVRAAGKGMSLEVISRVVTGNPFPVVSYPAGPKDGEEELRKKITTLLMYGDRLALFDNLTGSFGDGTLDRALTGTEWQDRVLGGNRQFRAPLAVTFFATGNNVAIRADTARRVCHVRLESPHERPEERTDVKRPHLIRWVVENRPRLLARALAILKGYHLAGRPDFELRPWGSFEAWSALVRNAVVWCGLPDPGLTRVAVQEQADETARGLRQLIAALEMIDPEGTGRTAAEIVTAAGEEGSSLSREVREMLREAVESLVAKPDGRKLGNRLRHLRRRVVEGKYIDLAGEDSKRVNRWAVFSGERLRARPEQHPPHAPHPASPAVPSPGREDVEHVEDVLAPDTEMEGSSISAGDEEVF
jgi:hypothetical protein